MPPPVRTIDTDYHYHVYDYVGAAAAGPWQPSPANPNRNGWQFYSMVQDLQGLQAFGAETNVPNIALNNVGAQTVPGARHTMELSFGSNAPNAPTVVITGGIHAREWIATEFVYLLAEYLVMHYTAEPQQNRYQRTIRDLLDSRRIRIIPMLNPDGNDYTVFSAEPGARLWRKNRRALPTNGAGWLPEVAPGGVPNPPFQQVQQGPPPAADAQYDVPDYDPVRGIPPNAACYRTRALADNATGVDLNRNVMTAAWGYECVPDNPANPNYEPTSNTYFGPRRASEIETGNLQQALAANPGIATSIDYHSYSKLILFPSEASHNNTVGPDYTSLGRTMQQLIRAQGSNEPDYELGTPLQLVRYNGTGTVIDHEAERYHSRAFAIELDPGRGDPDGFNLPETSIRMVFEKNIRAALAAIAAPGAAGNWLTAQFQRIVIAVAQLGFFGWNVYGRGNRLPLQQR